MRRILNPVTLASIVGLIFGFLSVMALLPGHPRDGIEIRKTEYGDRWPFAIQQGRLRCEGAGAVILTVQGKDYAVNGMASSSRGEVHSSVASQGASCFRYFARKQVPLRTTRM